MTNLVPTVPASITIADARETLKTELKLPDFIYYVFALEDLESERLCGVVTLRQLLTADPDATVRSIMREDLETAEPLAPAITVARQLLDAHLAALPVVAADGRLLGAVTIDAALQQVAPRSMRDEAPRIFS